jgi:glyceraldehyde 3-phosphate dehydrogenase
LQYDSVHGRYPGTISYDKKKNVIVVNGKTIKISNELDPTKINWGDAGADYVVESTGEPPRSE